MFNFFKLVFAINFIKSNVKQFITLAMLILLFYIVPHIFDDILTLVASSSRLAWVLIKWAILLLLIVGICRVIYIISVKPVESIYLFVEKEDMSVHKQELLVKKHLLSKGDRIKNKYREHR
ncbi:hypothetical protein [Colwellia sp. 12G3]|uniref:hypothetical protein n=1 Tax=Colwellia sp. 12G3 TaxID=2058299 RepID=UPI000C32DA0A|nr:hypothetical protein [Colwellia sp. 12G3]PKI12716.1 hypothetical protein CXF71_18450 [Colwellia sp. 12G3]